MSRLIAYQGLPGSGKTTKAIEALSNYAKGEAVRVNRDSIRTMLGSPEFSRKTEQNVIMLQHAMISSALCEGKIVICDDTNLNPATLQSLQQVAEQAGASFELDKTLLEVPVQVCVSRDATRPEPVGAQVILDMHLKYLAENLSTDSTLPEAVIVDIDGTLAHAKHRNVYDCSKLLSDEPDAAIVKLVKEQHSLGKTVLVMTGRNEDYREATSKWLNLHLQFQDYELYMRPSLDRRPDWLVKTELYKTNVLGKYSVDFVLDDRDAVVLTWRSLGLKCLQVGYGDF